MDNEIDSLLMGVTRRISNVDLKGPSSLLAFAVVVKFHDSKLRVAPLFPLKNEEGRNIIK